MAIQDVIAEIRTEHGLSQEKLAEKLFVTRQAVSRWETGETKPTVDMLKMIAEEFKVDAASLLGFSEAPVCQSCAMPMQNISEFGSNADSTANTEYCSHCYKEGAFTHDRSLDEMVESNLKFLDEFNAQNGANYSEEEARTVLKLHLTTLKRWQNSDQS